MIHWRKGYMEEEARVTKYMSFNEPSSLIGVDADSVWDR